MQETLENGSQEEELTKSIANIETNEMFLQEISIRPAFFVESNFVYLPIFSFDKKHSEKNSRITHTVPVSINGSLVTTTFSVATSDILDGGKLISPGLPGAFDMQILFALMDIWDEQGRSDDGLIKFKLNDIRKKLDFSDSGKIYSDIRSSVKKLSNTKINSNKAFFSAERAVHVDSTIGILNDPVFVDSKSSGNKDEFCTVFLSKHIISNLLKNYTTKVSRTLFHKLEIGFSQRILSLILFRQQNLHESSNFVDYDLMELATMLPMAGKLFPSTIKDRLKAALEELKEKKIFNHEFHKIGKNHFIRFIPVMATEDSLVGSGYTKDVLKMIKYVHGIDITKAFQISEDVISREVEQNGRVFTYKDRKYSWVFHVLDVLACQLTTGFVPQSPVAFLTSRIKEKTIDYPLCFDKAVDVIYREKRAKEDLTKAVVLKEQMKKSNDDEIFALAMNYAAMLNEDGRKFYGERVKEDIPLLQGVRLNFEIAELIAEDLKTKASTEIFKYLDQNKMEVKKMDQKQLMSIHGNS